VRNCNKCKNQWNWLVLLACVQSVQYYSDKINQDVGRSKLAPWSKVLREKIRVPQIVEKLPEFYRIRNVITVFTSVANCYVPWARLTQVTPFQSISLIPTLILFFHLHECHKNSLFPNMHFYFLMCATCPANLLILYLINQSQSARDKNLNSSVCYFYSLILFPAMSNIFLRHSIIKDLPSVVFFPQYRRPNFTSIQNGEQNIHIVCLVQSTEICPSSN